MLPEGWKLSNLGLIGKWAGGKTPSKANDSFWSNGTIPWVSPKDMITGKIFSTEDYITQVAIQENKNRLYPSGSIVVVTRSGILRKKLPVAIVEVPFTVNQDIKVLPDNKNISSEYIYNYIMCFEKIILKSCQKEGTTVESIDTDSFLSFPISLPPLPEQRKIAAILSTWDRAIEGTEKLLANSQRQKKALMQQLLTAKKRLPGFVGEWKSEKLGDICIIKTGKKDVNVSCFNGKYPFFTCAKEFLYSNEYSYDFEAILIAGNGEVGNSHYYKGKFEAYQRTYILSGFLEVHPFFIFLFVGYFLPIDIAKEKQHSAMPYIKLGTLKNFSIFLPPLPEQKAIAAVLTTADDEITAIKADLERLRREKKALMQQLLTGKRRVVVDAEVSA